MGYDGRYPDLTAQQPVEEWMTALRPTRDKPTAVKSGDITVVYWREDGVWMAREFGRSDLLPMSEKLLKVIEADQDHARRKLLE